MNKFQHQTNINARIPIIIHSNPLHPIINFLYIQQSQWLELNYLQFLPIHLFPDPNPQFDFFSYIKFHSNIANYYLKETNFFVYLPWAIAEFFLGTWKSWRFKKGRKSFNEIQQKNMQDFLVGRKKNIFCLCFSMFCLDFVLFFSYLLGTPA